MDKVPRCCLLTPFQEGTLRFSHIYVPNNLYLTLILSIKGIIIRAIVIIGICMYVYKYSIYLNINIVLMYIYCV